MNIENKWMRAAVPALLIHCSIGTVYCWSTFKEAIANTIGMSTFAVGWAFSLAIFFLGMSAAFAGRMVEKNIHLSSLISCIFFTVGMIGTGLSIQLLKGIPALISIFLFYGCIMGIGLGIGYLTPVKTLMLWFFKHRGLGTGISIMGFGLAKAIATPIMEFLQNKYGIAPMFYILGCIYFIMMMTGHFLLKKPKGWIEKDFKENAINIKTLIKNRTFVGIWLMFFLNIHCGLALITYEKQILNTTFATASETMLALIISTIPSFTAAFNAIGRIGFSTLSDHMKDRNTIYKTIFFLSLLITCPVLFSFGITKGEMGPLVIALLIVINAGYGGGFSTLPALLSSRFGMEQISKIHGITLSAWAIAGLTGNNMSEIILSATNRTYDYILIATLTLYVIAFIISFTMIGKQTHK